MANYQTVMSWIDQDFKFATPDNFVEKIEGGFRIYTDNNVYSISVKDNYLGCTVSSRKPRAGEDWCRGNDLADGEFSKDTWNAILADIVSYEMVKIHKKQEKEITIINN